MTTDPDSLIHGYLDDELGDESLRQLNDWLGQDPTNARRFAFAALLNDRLHDRLRSDLTVEAEFRRGVKVTPPPRLRTWAHRALIPMCAAAIVVFGLLGLHLTTSRHTHAAEAELERLIAASDQDVDRTYRIASLNKPQPPGPPPDQDRARVRPPIDGALLHARGGNRHVLVRRFPSGQTFITGSNGHESWAIPPDGPVHVSSDPTRYRGAAPGEKQNVPFQIPQALSQLRDAYDLQIEEGDAGHGVFSRLVARKRSANVRGPWRVELWFHSGSDVIERMRFEGLPSANANTLSLELQLVDEHDLGPDFFEHGSHHAADRVVIQEP
jgi:hypothetical protein